MQLDIKIRYLYENVYLIYAVNMVITKFACHVLLGGYLVSLLQGRYVGLLEESSLLLQASYLPNLTTIRLDLTSRTLESPSLLLVT